ncbi:MAG TPA: hypothetical protein VF912_19170 [Anaeromyxobacter sp.]
MNALVWAISGLGATVVLTVLLAGAQGFGLTRMNLPYLLGSIFTPDRDRARIVGIVVHLANGWIFSLVYFAVFAVAGRATVHLGAFVGLLHGLFVAAVGLPALPAFHPRVARPYAGPTTERWLEPPGFMGRNYGWSTAAVLVTAHVAFGALLAVGASLSR